MLIPKRILTVSSANMDFVMSVSKIPQGGETQLENGTYQFVPGGKGANSAVAAVSVYLPSVTKIAFPSGKIRHCPSNAIVVVT